MSVVTRVPQLAKMPMPPDQTIDASCVFALSMKAAEAQPTRGGQPRRKEIRMLGRGGGRRLENRPLLPIPALLFRLEIPRSQRDQ